METVVNKPKPITDQSRDLEQQSAPSLSGLSLRFHGKALRAAGLSPDLMEVPSILSGTHLSRFHLGGLSQWSLSELQTKSNAMPADEPWVPSNVMRADEPWVPADQCLQVTSQDYVLDETNASEQEEDGAKEHFAPPHPVSPTKMLQADVLLKQSLDMLAKSNRWMPWINNMEIGPGIVYSGFVDDDGLPDLFGYIKYFGEDESLVDRITDTFRVHVQTQHEVAENFDRFGRHKELSMTARYEVRPISTLPSVVTHTVNRKICSTPALAVYIGELRKGRRHGLGRMKYSSGNEYVGTWEVDQLQGVGVERRYDHTLYYGSITRKRRHGYGLLVERHKAGFEGFRTTEGIFTDGHRDMCAVGGHMPADRFHIKRDLFLSFFNGESVLVCMPRCSLCRMIT